MEDDSFAFFVFSGFVAASTVVTWAIVTYLSKERSIDSARKRVQMEDLSWMESDSTQPSPLKQGKPKAKSSKNLSKQSLKAKTDDEATKGTNEIKIQEVVESPIAIEEMLQVQQAVKPVTEIKPKAPKKKKETSKNDTVVSKAKATQPMEPKVPSVKPLVDDEDEFNPDEWQAVPAKGSKPATGSKIKDSETPENQSESRPKKPVVREKPAEKKKEVVEAPVKSGGTDSSIALKSDRNLSKFHDAPRVSTANHINLPHGEGSPMSENLEHSDSTEELVESQTNVQLTAEVPVITQGHQKAIPSKNTNSSASQSKPAGRSTTQAGKKVEPPGPATGGTTRVKRNSERSTASVSSKTSKKDDGAPEVSPEVLKLEDELKRERNHSQDLISKYLQLTEQLEKEKQTIGSISEQLQQKVQECMALKSQLNSAPAQTPVPSTPTMEDTQLREEMKKQGNQLEMVYQEKLILQKELERATASSHDLRRENAMKQQAAEAQLKKIESRNNELQEQCNIYEKQLKSAVSKQQESSAKEKESRLVYQITGLEAQLKESTKEIELLRQQHEATYSEMSRLTESKISLKKYSDQLKAEVDDLQQQIMTMTKENALNSRSQQKQQMQNGAHSSPEEDGSASAAYDWSQANSDTTQLSQLQSSISTLGKENETLRSENEQLKKEIHSMQQHGPPARPQQNGAVDSDDPDSQDESESIPAVGSGVDGSTMTSPLKGVGLGGENSISVSEVGSRLKETLLRLYPDEYSTQQPIAFQSNDWVSLVALFEHQAAVQIERSSQKDMCYATELDSYKDQLHQSAAEKDELARRNQRFQAALSDTVQIIY
ncbi:uncharacterized protein LOC142352094 isoform X2 [Convolutriloba macropyga]|uniref:uncharacterized protein LOC142352094 isoform X2 n=1 Tax=Convolutriloba macropyga TaxID=536237 RepID=UPI003F520418